MSDYLRGYEGVMKVAGLVDKVKGAPGFVGNIIKEDFQNIKNLPHTQRELSRVKSEHRELAKAINQSRKQEQVARASIIDSNGMPDVAAFMGMQQRGRAGDPRAGQLSGLKQEFEQLKKNRADALEALHYGVSLPVTGLAAGAYHQHNQSQEGQ